MYTILRFEDILGQERIACVLLSTTDEMKATHPADFWLAATTRFPKLFNTTLICSFVWMCVAAERFLILIATRHRASTSMYSVTFCVRVTSPERHHWKTAVQTAAVILRTPPSTASYRPASHARFPYTARNFENAPRHPPVTGQQCAYIPPSVRTMSSYHGMDASL